uniref:Uncharacterized protein n=2 Tax=Papio anubis TaxID=9555 RepID=A0A8I5MVW1_PAPAN
CDWGWGFASGQAQERGPLAREGAVERFLTRPNSHLVPAPSLQGRNFPECWGRNLLRKECGKDAEEKASHRLRCPGPRYKDHQSSGFQTSPPSSPVPAQPHTIMCQTSCSPGCQPTCCIPSPCQASCYMPVSCQSSVCVPMSCTRIVCVAPSCQPSVCVPVSYRPIIYVTPSCQSSGCCQPPCTTILCRPISYSAPSCC